LSSKVVTEEGAVDKGGATNLKVGGSQCIGRQEVNTEKPLKFAKGGGCMTPPHDPPPPQFPCLSITNIIYY